MTERPWIFSFLEYFQGLYSSILTSYKNLIGVTKCNHIHWPLPIIMVNRKVRIKVLNTPLWYNSVQKTIKSFLIPNKSNRKKVIIHSNSCNRVSIKLVEKLESYLDTEPTLRTDCDVLTLVGTQSRAQKASTINGLINGFVGVNCNPDILLCATSGVIPLPHLIFSSFEYVLKC